jgi:vacuolar protein sorting-associated protein 45
LYCCRCSYANFGDLGTAIKQLLDEYQQLAKLNENISSIEDMQNFMERYPAFRSQSLNVSKHVALMTELARLVDSNVLLDVSQLEQEIACSSDYSAHRRELFEKFDNPAIQPGDKLRLAMLFVVKYESNNAIREVKPRLIASGVPEV